MKIIHIVLGKANPNRMNGVNKIVNNLATYQKKLGHDVWVFGITHTPQAPIPERNFQTKLFSAIRHKLWLDPALKQAVSEMNSDVICHIHGGFIPEFYHISKLLAKFSIPYVHTAHGAYNKIAMERSKWQKKIYFQLFEKQLLENAKALHFIGQSEVNAIQELMPEANCVLIPNGQQLSANYMRISKHNQSPIFGFCGRLDVHTKGLDIMIHAFAKFSQGKPKARLWIIGDSDERPDLEELVQKLGIAYQVTFWGKLFGEEKDALIQQMDVFMHPSRNEGLPGAVLEAAALHIPCIVSQESNLGKYVEQYEAGYCLAENNADHLAVAMGKIYLQWLRPEGLRQLQRNAYNMVKEAFNWHHITHQHLALYQTILQDHPKSA